MKIRYQASVAGLILVVGFCLGFWAGTSPKATNTARDSRIVQYKKATRVLFEQARKEMRKIDKEVDELLIEVEAQKKFCDLYIDPPLTEIEQDLEQQRILVKLDKLWDEVD